MMTKLRSNHHLVLLLLFAAALFLRSYGISEQPPLDDEVGAASSAENYLATGMLGQVMWYHPPLRNFVVLASSRLCGGYTAWGLRLGSILFGSLTVPVLGYLVYGLFRSRSAAYLASLFLCIDPLHISLSREAFQESTTPFLMVAGVLAAYHGIRKDNLLYIYLSGALFGLATASKWHGLFPWAVCAVAYLAAPRLLNKDWEEPHAIATRIPTAIAAYAALPVVVYVAVYLPWLLRGHSLGEFASFQRSLVNHHRYLHVVPSRLDLHLPRRAYEWFLWPIAWTDFVYSQGKPYLNIAFGNFLVWGLTLPSLFYAVRRWWRDGRAFELGFAIMLFLLSYLPLALTTSRGIWVFSAPAVIPFAFILSAYMLGSLRDIRRISRVFIATYLAAVLVLSALLYPPATFHALDLPYARPIADLYSPDTGRQP